MLPASGSAQAPLLTKAEYTVDEALSLVGYGTFQVMMLFFAGIAVFADAMEMMLISFIAPAVKCEWGLTNSQEVWLSSIVFVGMMLGSYVWGALSDIKGRVFGCAMTISFTGLFGLASAFSPQYWVLMTLRFLVGFGLGGAPIAESMYSEYVAKELRGVFLVLIELFWTAGSITTAGIAWLVMGHLNLGWKGLLIACCTPLLLLLLIIPFIPESPHFLVVNGRMEEAEEVTKWMAKWNCKALPENFSLVNPGRPKESDSPLLQQLGIQMKRLFASSLLRTTLSVLAGWIVAIAGYYGIVLLTTAIHENDENEADKCVENTLHFLDSDYRSILIASCGSLVSFPIDLLAVDTIGRKWSMVISFALTAASMAPLLANVGLRTLWLFLARMFANSGFIMIIVYTPEVYPTVMRTYATGTANLAGRFAGVFAPYGGQFILAEYGLKWTAAVFIILYLGGALAALVLPKDTKGTALQSYTVEDKVSTGLESEGESQAEEADKL